MVVVAHRRSLRPGWAWRLVSEVQWPALQGARSFPGCQASRARFLREGGRPGSRVSEEEAVQAVATVETPPLVAADIVGAWQPLETTLTERVCESRQKAKKEVFSKHCRKWRGGDGRQQLGAAVGSTKSRQLALLPTS